ncbi:MAG TPA: hypothetical protein VEH28_07450 [Thermoplasmata archaeon]|nr:hypothetical protein [Thermoplasmata archaeon]
MQFHRVRRLAATLVASQLRSGRSSSDPKSFFGRSEIIAVIDAGLFLAAAGLAAVALRGAALSSGEIAAGTTAFIPFVPLVAVSVVLLAGVMFELTTTAKFASSDAANWLPISPGEYLAASVSAIAYTYSPAVAITLGALLPPSILGSTLPLYGATVALAVLALIEGAVLVEMIRAGTQRVTNVAAGRRGQVNLLFRALALILVILLLQFAFNPVFFLALAQRLSTVALVTAVVPFFWSTEALSIWAAGNTEWGAAFALAQVAFVAVLGYLAVDLRERYWVPTPIEVRLEAHRYAARNPLFAAFGLSAAESALAIKDLKGLVRRREMLPTLVVPIVLVVLVLVEGNTLGGVVSVLWIGWVAGFFALLLAGTSVGQERKALQSLYAFPLSAASVLRAKVAFVLVPSFVVSLGLVLLVGFFFGLPPGAFLGVLFLVITVSVVLTFWGLAFAARYSDFQDRPRPQFLRPAGMLAATGSGMALLFAILIPGTVALLYPSSAAVPLGLMTVGLVLVGGVLGIYWTRSGFRQLFRELPF